jgi:glycosyltransferase involved in cell wall biosynthesis
VSVRVAVLTTSYPRHEGDVAGRFIQAAVERLEAAGVEVRVVSPAQFPHFGLAYGDGIVGNLRQRPWRALAVPLFLAAFVRAARRAARDADVVHAHWLPSAAVGVLTRRPVIAQVWGTDVELARHVPWLARRVLRRARLVIAPSTTLADAVRKLGAAEVRVIPSGVDVPADPGAEEAPPFVLYAGRLSAEKGILELVEAANGIALVVAGDGPLRDRVPGALGFVPHEELRRLYGRAAVVAVPSHREGFGVVCAEAMAYGRPVVAGAVGGLLDLVVDGETGLHVPPGDVQALRAALRRLLADPELRRRLGAAGRERVRERFSWAAVTAATTAAYEDVRGGTAGAPPRRGRDPRR